MMAIRSSVICWCRMISEVRGGLLACVRDTAVPSVGVDISGPEAASSAVRAETKDFWRDGIGAPRGAIAMPSARAARGRDAKP